MISSESTGKWKVYFITFFAYAAMHTMRMIYAQIKPEFKSAFHQSNLYLGLFDGFIYISLGVGLALRFLFQTKMHGIRTYFIFMTLSCLGFVFIPIISLIFKEDILNSYLLKEILPSVGLIIFGFCQLVAWPTLLTLVSQKFNLKQSGAAIGIWSACGDVGNITGFLLSWLLVSQLHVRWEFAMILTAVLSWTGALLVYLLIGESNKARLSYDSPLQNDQWIELKQGQQIHIDNDREDKSSVQEFKQFIAYVQKFISLLENKLYLLAMSLAKSILYGFLLWIPLYLSHQNIAYYKSTIPISFNIGALVGSYILGHYYEAIQYEQGSQWTCLQKHFKVYSLFYCCMGLTITFIILYFVKVNIVMLFGLSLIGGILVGGCFNILSSNELIVLSSGNEEVNKLSTLTMAAANLLVGVTEIIIGVVLNINESSDKQNQLFLILLCIGIISIGVILWRIHLRFPS